MPIFEYHCESCDQRFERLRERKQSETAECPKCGELAKKQLSSFAMSTGSSGASAPCGSSSPSCGGGG